MARPQSYATLEQVLEIYAGVWGAAADSAGANYWVAGISAGRMSLVETAASFFDQPLVQEHYSDHRSNPLTGDTLLDALYQNIFKVANPDAEGLSYWQGRMSVLGITNYDSPNIGLLVMEMIDGMWSNPDAEATQALYHNWIETSLAFIDAQSTAGIDLVSLDADQQEAFLDAARNLVGGIDARSTDADIQDAVTQAMAGMTGGETVIRLDQVGDSITATDGRAEIFVLSFDSSSGQSRSDDAVVTIQNFNPAEDTLRFEDAATSLISAEDFLDVDQGGALIVVDQFADETMIAFADPTATDSTPTAEITLSGILAWSLGGNDPFFEIVSSSGAA